MHSSTRPWQISGIAGLLFVVTSFVASAQPLHHNQDSAVIAAWFAENGLQYRVGRFVAGLAFPLFTSHFSPGCAKGFGPWKRLPPSGHA